MLSGIGYGIIMLDGRFCCLNIEVLMNLECASAMVCGTESWILLHHRLNVFLWMDSVEV